MTPSADQDADQDPTPTRRRGRRPAGEDTRSALIEAAKTVFAESGYDGATVRTIAAAAGVDPAMVNHWFGGKEGLFVQAVLRVPFDPRELISELLDGDADHIGERIARTFLTRWDGAGGDVFAALVRSLAGHPQVAQAMRDFFVKHLFSTLLATLDSDQPQLRANLCASQLMGLGLTRYVAQFEPLSTTGIERLVHAVAPTLQRYLTGDIDSLPSPPNRPS